MRRVIMTMAVAAGLPSWAPAQAQDAAQGMATFKARCSACHNVQGAGKSGVGPNLVGVVGRKAASVPGFNYSSALKASGVKWDEASLSKFLAGPGKMVPGTRMFATIPDEKARANVVGYLKNLKAQ